MKKECPKCFKQHSARNREVCKLCFDSSSANMSSASSLNMSQPIDTTNQFSQMQQQNTNNNQQMLQQQQLRQQPQQQQQNFMNNNSINNENSNNNNNNTLPNLSSLNFLHSQPTYSMFTNGQTQMDTRSRRSVDPHLNDDTGNGSSMTPLSSINVAQLTNIIQTCINPVQAEIQDVKNLFTQKVTVLENKVSLLEKENEKLKEGNSVLTGIVVNMQSSLNRMENDKRSLNLIMSRIPENDMQSDNGILNDDKAKVSYVISKLNLDSEFCENIEVERSGRVNPGKVRFLKVKVPTKDNRNDILNKKGIH